MGKWCGSLILQVEVVEGRGLLRVMEGKHSQPGLVHGRLMSAHVQRQRMRANGCSVHACICHSNGACKAKKGLIPSISWGRVEPSLPALQDRPAEGGQVGDGADCRRQELMSIAWAVERGLHDMRFG